MARFLIHHRHAPQECGAVFASFRGEDTPLRRRDALASCAFGGHAIWWSVDVASQEDALALLPYFVAERATVTRVGKVQIP